MRRIYFVLTLLLVLLSACSQNKQKETSANQQRQAAMSVASTNKDQSVSTEWTPEPIAIGIALNEGVLIYVDSSRQAAILDTLSLAEDILAMVLQRHEQPMFDRSGWIQVETWGGRRGWVRRDGMIILTQFIIATDLNDSVFVSPDLQSTYLGVYGPNENEVIDERVLNDGRTWLSLRRKDSMWGPTREWVLIKKLKFDLKNAYLRILTDFVGFRSGSLFDDFKIVYRSKTYDVILEIANRVETMKTRGEPMPEALYNADDEVSVSTAVLLPYARSKVYFLQGELDKLLMEMEKIMTQYADQQLVFGRAGPEIALELAEHYLSMVDTTRAIAQFHNVISKYPGEPREGLEWKYYTDLEAVDRIVAVLEKRPQQLLVELDKIVSETKFPAVRLEAYAVKVQYLGSQGLLAAMVDTALAAIEHDPDVVHTFGQSTVDFASKVVAAAILVFEQRGDSIRIAQFAQTLQNRFPSDLVDAIATLKWAQFVAKRNGDPALVRRLYQHIIDDFSAFEIYDPITRAEYGTRMARQYLGIE